MMHGNDRTSGAQPRRVRRVVGAIAAVVLVYLTLVIGFGRPLSIVTIPILANATSAPESSTAAPANWDPVDPREFPGMTVAGVRSLLGEPQADNSLAATDGFLVAGAYGDIVGIPDDQLTVVGYCAHRDGWNQDQLTLGAASAAAIPAEVRQALAGDDDERWSLQQAYADTAGCGGIDNPDSYFPFIYHWR